MVIFNSYVKLPEGIALHHQAVVFLETPKEEFPLKNRWVARSWRLIRIKILAQDFFEFFLSDLWMLPNLVMTNVAMVFRWP